MRTPIAAVILTSLVVSSPVHADTQYIDALKICAADTDPEARVACYMAVGAAEEAKSNSLNEVMKSIFEAQQTESSNKTFDELTEETLKRMESSLSDGFESGPPLTNNEIIAIRYELQRCWNPPKKESISPFETVEIRVQMKDDGRVESAEVVDLDLYERDNRFKLLADTALEAVQNRECQPYLLPTAKYESWKTMTLGFSSN